MSTNAKQSIVACVAIASLTALAIPAFADQAPVSVTEAVQYSPQDLSTKAGAAEVYQRIRQAAQRVCRVASREINVVDRNVAVRACYKITVARAITDANRIELLAIHRPTRFAAR